MFRPQPRDRYSGIELWLSLALILVGSLLLLIWSGAGNYPHEFIGWLTD